MPRHQLVSDELSLDRVACHEAVYEIRHGRSGKSCDRIVEIGSFGKFFICNRIGFIGCHEVRVFDAIKGRTAGPASLERIIELVSELRATPHDLHCDLSCLEDETTHR